MARWCLAFLAASCAWASKAVPPPPVSYVHNEHVVSDGASRRLTAILGDLERTTGHQFAVGLFQSLDEDDLDGYVNRVFKAWKLGSKKKDDGLLFCLFLKERRWKVEVGYGLEGTLTDLEAAEIARSEGSPRFKAGDFDEGVLDTVQALGAKLAGDKAPEARAMRRDGPDSGRLLHGLWYVLLGFYLVFWLTYERGFHWGMDDWSIGRRSGADPRYPFRALFILGLYLLFLLRWGFDLLRAASVFGGGRGEGGFSGGGGSSGGGGASGDW